MSSYLEPWQNLWTIQGTHNDVVEDLIIFWQIMKPGEIILKVIWITFRHQLPLDVALLLSTVKA